MGVGGVKGVDPSEHLGLCLVGKRVTGCSALTIHGGKKSAADGRSDQGIVIAVYMPAGGNNDCRAHSSGDCQALPHVVGIGTSA